MSHPSVESSAARLAAEPSTVESSTVESSTIEPGTVEPSERNGIDSMLSVTLLFAR